MWQWLMGLEGERFDLSEKLKRQKYDVSHRHEHTGEEVLDVWEKHEEELDKRGTRDRCGVDKVLMSSFRKKKKSGLEIQFLL